MIDIPFDPNLAIGSVRISWHSLFAFVGRPEQDKKHRMAVGMLDHTAGVAAACGAELFNSIGCVSCHVDSMTTAPEGTGRTAP